MAISYDIVYKTYSVYTPEGEVRFYGENAKARAFEYFYFKSKN